MSEITKEHFETVVANLATKQDLAPLATKQDVREGFEELTLMVSSGFDDIRDRLDVRERVTRVEHGLRRIAQELHISL